MNTITTSARGKIPSWTLGERIRKAREDAGLEQIDVARAVYKTRQAVSGWERDAHRPNPLELRAISELTGVDLVWLLTGEAPGHVSTWNETTAGHRPEMFALAA